MVWYFSRRWMPSRSVSSSSSASSDPRQLLGGVVRHPDEHVRQLAHAFAGLKGKPYPTMRSPQGRMSIGCSDRRRAGPHADHPPLRPREMAVPASSASPSASRWRGGAANRGRHLHQDRRHRLRPHEDRLQDQETTCATPASSPTAPRQRGRLCRPHGDGFETYGVTGVRSSPSSSSRSGTSWTRREGGVQIQLWSGSS